MRLPFYTSPEQLPNKPWTGRPQPRLPRQKAWPRLAAVLVVGVVATGVALYIQSVSEEPQPPADLAVAPVLATRQQCIVVNGLYGDWLDGNPPVTLEQARELDAGTARAALAAGHAFETGLDSLPDWLVPDLVAALRKYNEQMAALHAALSTGPASPAQIEDLLSAGAQVHVAEAAFLDVSCP